MSCCRCKLVDDATELRTKLDEARAELGLSVATYTDTSLSGVNVKAVHITELRTKVAETVTTIDIRWLVSDQLGTPRMIFDQTGSLAYVSRHDYLPFGEEIFAGTGGRTAALGYTNADGARQKFTSYERDSESGLDYAHARYYASIQGRFTGVDPLSGDIAAPQSLNRYTYVGNSPLNATDPAGLAPQSAGYGYYGKGGEPMVALYNQEGVYDRVDSAQDASFDDMKTTTQLGRELLAFFYSVGQAMAAYQQTHPQNSSVTDITLAYYIADKRLVVSRSVQRNGDRFPVMDGGFTINNVTSGLEGCLNDPGCVQQRDKGPTPPGVYEMNTNEISEASLVRSTARMAAKVATGGRVGGDWGSFRVPLHPVAGTETFGRDGFYLHGGALAGSKGWIDVGGGIGGDNTTERLVRWMRSDTDGRIRLVVISRDR